MGGGHASLIHSESQKTIGRIVAKKRRAKPQTTDEFGYGRSTEASKFAYDVCKVIAQSCLLINGGAATAVIALMGKEKVDASILTYVPIGLVGYAMGVVVSALMLFCVMMLADNWNYFWYYSSLEKDEVAAIECEDAANWWHGAMYWAFAGAILCFAISSGLVGYGMTNSAPTVIVSRPAK